MVRHIGRSAVAVIVAGCSLVVLADGQLADGQLADGEAQRTEEQPGRASPSAAWLAAAGPRDASESAATNAGANAVPSNGAERVVAMVKNLKGDVRVERNGAQTPLAGGATLRVADRVVTGADGQVGLVFDDNSRVALGANSNYRIDAFEFDSTTHEGKFDGQLTAGTLAMVSGKLAKQSPDAVKVRTPANILGVRGTEFIVEVKP